MGFQKLNIKIRYRSDLNNFPRDFLVPVLEKSLVYKRGVGYFSTSSLIDISFRGGTKMQTVQKCFGYKSAKACRHDRNNSTKYI